jgi:hypothetical protein
MANSTRISGIDQRRRKTTHATRKEPPPLDAAIRGNRQMLPVPTAMPSMASIIPQRLENWDMAGFGVRVSGFGRGTGYRGGEALG